MTPPVASKVIHNPSLERLSNQCKLFMTGSWAAVVKQQTRVLSHVSSFVLTSCILPPFLAKSELETLDAQLSSTHKL